LRQGDGPRGPEGAQQVDHADAADDNGVAGKDRNVGKAAVKRIRSQIDDDGFRDTRAADSDDVAGGSRETTCSREDIQQAPRTDDWNHCMDFTNDGRNLIGAFDELKRDLRVAVDLCIYEALLDDLLGLRDGLAVQIHSADERQQDAAISVDADLRDVVGLLEDANLNEVAGREHGIAGRRKQQSAVGCDRGR
jgi:hypothetical protein